MKKFSSTVATMVTRVLPLLVIASLCLMPVVTSSPAQAAPPPGSPAATQFSGSSSPAASSASSAAGATSQTTVETDKFKYQPDETATISGGGYTPGAEVTITLTAPDGKTSSWTTTADSSGSISTSYNMGNSIEGAYTIQLTDGTNSATTMFTDPTTSAYLYPEADVAHSTDLKTYYELGHKPSPNQNWNYVNDPYSTSGNPPTGNDGDDTLVYTNITGDHFGHNTPVTDIYQITNLPGGFDLYTTSGTLETPNPTCASGQQVNTWTKDNKIVMQWNSVPSGTGTTDPTVTVTTVCREHGWFADGRVQILLVQPTSHSGETTYTYTPDQGSSMTNNWEVYSVTLNKAPDGEDWSISNINSLKAGVALSQLGDIFGEAGMTQMYIEVAPGVISPVLANYNYHWDSSSDTSTTNTSTPQITLTDGTHTFYVNAEDTEGNTTPYGTSGQYLIDTLAPTLTKLIDGSSAKSGWYNASDVGSDNRLDVSLTASDTNGTMPVSGVNYIVYKIGSDSAQTVSNSSTTGAIGNGKSATQTVTFVISTLNGTAPINQGAVTLQHSATDVAGNTGSSPAGSSQVVLIDTQNPLLTKTLTGTEGNNGWYTSSSVGVTLNASDATPGSGVDNIQYSVNGGSPVTKTNTTVTDPTYGIKSGSYSTEATIDTQGVNTISHVAYDVAGNSSANNPGSATSPQTIKIDSNSPLLTKTLTSTEGNNGWYTSSVGVTLNASDATPGSGVDNIQYSVNGGATQTATNTTVIDTTNAIKSSSFSTGTTINTEGNNKITHVAYDVAGNSSANNSGSATSPQYINVDTQKPTLTKTINGAAPRDGSVNNGWYNASDVDASGNLNVQLSAADATSGVQSITYSKDGAITTDTNSSTTYDVINNSTSASHDYNTNFTINKEGTTALTHSAMDMAGNTYVLAVQDVKLDTILPTLVKSIARTGLDQVTVTLSGADDTSGSGINNITYTADGSTAVTVLGGGDFSKDTTFVVTGAGAHDLTHNIMDIAGNQFTLANQTVNIGGIAGNTGRLIPTNTVPVLTVSLQNGPVTAHPVTPAGMLISDADVTSPDGMIIASIPAGTTVLDKDGNPAYLSKDPDIFSIASSGTEMPKAPEGYQMVSSYDLLPNGISFDSPITLAINYDPGKMPSGKQPVIAYYDEGTGKWVEVETAGYIAADGTAVAHTAMARVNHFTRFAVMAR